MYPCKVTVKEGVARSFKSGDAWIYDNEVERVEGDLMNDDPVIVLNFDGYPLGDSFLNMYSKLRIRMMTRYVEQRVDEAFLRQRPLDAIRLRKQVINTSACRLVFGETDSPPGLTVDKFGDILVLESLALGMDRMKETVLRLLLEVLSGEGLPICSVYEWSDAKGRLKEGMERHRSSLSTSFDTKIEIRKNDVRYLVDVAEGQEIGFLLDQKLSRRAIQRFAPGVRVLDCFTRTGSFTLNAGLAGAREVLGVDTSMLGVAQATENAALNGLSAYMRFEIADMFKLLPKLEVAKERFELMILDPSAFTRSRETIKHVIKDHRNINLHGMEFVRDGDFLVTCSCSYFMDQELSARTLQKATYGARKRPRQIHSSMQAPDYSILWAAGETYYLKFFILQVLGEK